MRDTFSRCHPILNFIYFAGVFAITMFTWHPLLLGISFLAAITYGIYLCGWRKILRQNLLFNVPMLFLVALICPLFNHYGVTSLYYIESSGNSITLESIVYGQVLGFVLCVTLLWFACFNRIMTTDKFVYLFGKILPSLSLLLSMSFRFVPHFLHQLHVIRNGQKAMGMDMSNAKGLKKIRYALNIFSILVTWALENAIETADSMKSRGYGLPGRKAYSKYRFERRDFMLLSMMAVLYTVIGYGLAHGAGYASYNPRILIAGFQIMGYSAEISAGMTVLVLTYAAFAGLCFLPLILDAAEQMQISRSLSHMKASEDQMIRNIYERYDTDFRKEEQQYD